MCEAYADAELQPDLSGAWADSVRKKHLDEQCRLLMAQS